MNVEDYLKKMFLLYGDNISGINTRVFNYVEDTVWATPEQINPHYNELISINDGRMINGYARLCKQLGYLDFAVNIRPEGRIYKFADKFFKEVMSDN